MNVYLPILEDTSGKISQSFDQLLDLLMTGKEALATRTLAKEGFQGTPNEESTSGEMIAALSNSQFR